MSLLMLLLAGGNAEAKKYKPAPRTAKNIVIAHRGYWNTPGAFENSIKAIDNAMNFGIYGSEFDINFTADDSIVVVHGSKHPVVKDLVIQESTTRCAIRCWAMARKCRRCANICLPERAIRRRN